MTNDEKKILCAKCAGEALATNGAKNAWQLADTIPDTGITVAVTITCPPDVPVPEDVAKRLNESTRSALMDSIRHTEGVAVQLADFLRHREP